MSSLEGSGQSPGLSPNSSFEDLSAVQKRTDAPAARKQASDTGNVDKRANALSEGVMKTKVRLRKGAPKAQERPASTIKRSSAVSRRMSIVLDGTPIDPKILAKDLLQSKFGARLQNKEQLIAMFMKLVEEGETDG